MRHSYASVDAFVDAFDKRIVGFLDKNRESIIRSIREKAGKPVEDAEVESFLSTLGDRIYDSVELDPAQLDRFANFYVSDAKMHGLVEKLIDSDLVFPKPLAASSPVDVALEIRSVATAVMSGSCSVEDALCRLDCLCRNLCG